MKDYKFTINGNIYKVSITSIDENIANVEVNGTPYKVEMDRPSKKQIIPLTRPQKAPVTPAGEPVVSRPMAASQPGAIDLHYPVFTSRTMLNAGGKSNAGRNLPFFGA